MWHTYKITNNVNGKVYIGKCKGNPHERWTRHVSDAKRGASFLLHKAIRKYGRDAFTLNVINQHETENQVVADEKQLIAEFQTNIYKFPTGNGYNLTDGGEGAAGRVVKETTRQKISQKLKGRVGHIKTTEERRKISERMKKQQPSVETRAKFAARKIGNQNRSRPVIVTFFNNVIEYISVVEAMKSLKVGSTVAYRLLRGELTKRQFTMQYKNQG